MRPVASFRSWYTQVRAVRIALAASAVAGLVVIAACTDSSDKGLTAPKAPAAPRLANSSSGGFANSKHVDLCVDPTSPPGVYQFIDSNENNKLALTGNGFQFSGVWKDQGDGGTGTTVFNDAATPGAAYPVSPMSAPGNFANCVRVLDRTAANVNYDPNSATEANRTDSYAGVTVTYSSNNVGATYDHTDCVLDVGVIPPQHTLTIPAAWSAATNYVAGDRATTNLGNKVWRALVPNTNVPPTEGATWTNVGVSGDCDTGNNPTRAFANFEHGTVVTFHFNPQPLLTECTLGYPDNSNLPKSAADFNESEVLTGFALESGKLHAWYSDEHALTLGVDSVFIKNKNPTPSQGFHYDIELMAGHGNPGPLTSGVTGNPIKTGRAPGATDAPIGLGDPVDGAGRPLAPGLYLTDLTVNGVNSRAGDWQQGGTPVSPNALYGTWKGALVTIDNTHNPATTKLTPAADPAKNHKIVGTGGLNPPPGAQDFGFSSDIVWNISNPPFIPGHDYRAQVIVHDGDQNKTGGDVGQACINIDQ